MKIPHCIVWRFRHWFTWRCKHSRGSKDCIWCGMGFVK